MFRFSVLLVALAALSSAPAAQTQQVLFPGETGETLLASIRAAYRPSSLNGSNDDLYATVDRTTVDNQDGVVCVYTGLFVPFDGVPNNDPSQDVFNGGSPTGATINQEHTYPRSRLNGNSSASSESDLHNLFPTQVGVNADRGNLPFADIPDAQATRWYQGAPPYSQTSVPSSDIDAYSEISASAFEPREDHKGNVARAMFYIQAVYPDQADEAWFDTQSATFYDWHYADPITEADQARSARVASFQSGKHNPFVLDSTLARRAFFPNIVVIDTEEEAATALALHLHGPNPFRDQTRLSLTASGPTPVRADLLDALGRRVQVLHNGLAPAGSLELTVEGGTLAPGVYLVRVETPEAVLTRRLVRTR